MKWILPLSAAVLCYCVAVMVLSRLWKKRIAVEARLNSIRTDRVRQKSGSAGKKSRLSFLHISQSMKADMNLAGIQLTPEEFVLLWIFIAFAPAALSSAVWPSMLRSVILVLTGVALPQIYLKIKISKRRALFERQLGDALMVLSNALRAGFSFQQALANAAEDLADPIGGEFRTACRELKLGMDVESTLSKVADRMASNDLRLITTAVVVQQQVGGNLSEILDTISQTIRDRLAIKRSIKTLTAQGRISGKIIGGIPMILLLMISMINPTYMTPLFETAVGKLMLAFGFVMEYVGFLVIGKIVNLKF